MGGRPPGLGDLADLGSFHRRRFRDRPLDLANGLNGGRSAVAGRRRPPPGAIELLPWDTDFFGFRIGRVREVPAAYLPAIAEKARAAGLDCLYLYQAPGQLEVGAAEAGGFDLVEVQVDLQRPTGAAPGPTGAPGVEVRAGTRADLAALEPVIKALAPWSRFAADPRFGDQAAARMYRAWAEGAADRPDDLMAVAVRDGQVIGLVTAAGEATPRIGLIGAAVPGGGTGAALMEAVLAWARARAETLSVTTQVRNLGALRFYARHGFQVADVRYIYHLWPRRPTGAGS